MGRKGRRSPTTVILLRNSIGADASRRFLRLERGHLGKLTT
jgi:hypothetical protein